MRIITDIMGGDNPPEELIKGAAEARAEYGADITLVGDAGIINTTLTQMGANPADFEIIDAPEAVTMNDSPMSITQAHKNSSMAVALRRLAGGGGDACVSCGNTGALFTGATLYVKRAKGVRRAALAMILPYKKPVLMLDCGANVTVTAEYLVSFAYLGSIYMERVCGIASPRVALANNGAEAHKGTPVVNEAYHALKEAGGINFIGNIEGKDIPFDACDVIVCDGFTGNLILKTSEGLCKFVMEKVNALLESSLTGRIAAKVASKKLYEAERFFDAAEYGGAPFLGISKPVIKAHGSSDALAFKNAIRQAVGYAGSGVTEELANRADMLSDAISCLASNVAKANERKKTE